MTAYMHGLQAAANRGDKHARLELVVQREHEPWCPGCQPCCECGGTCKTCTCDSSTLGGEMDPKELYDDILKQADVSSLLMAAEVSLNHAISAARETTQAKLWPFTDGASDTRLMMRICTIRRDLHEFRMSAGPLTHERTPDRYTSNYTPEDDPQAS